MAIATWWASIRTGGWGRARAARAATAAASDQGLGRVAPPVRVERPAAGAPRRPAAWALAPARVRAPRQAPPWEQARPGIRAPSPDRRVARPASGPSEEQPGPSADLRRRVLCRRPLARRFMR